MEDDAAPRRGGQSADRQQDDTQMRDKSMNVSMRRREQAKKMQKYDSNSIDEEEF